jgi:hypothetical protein
MSGEKILFWDQAASERGATISTYNYAHYNEVILGNKSLIAVSQNSDPEALEIYRKRFDDVIVINNFEKLYELSRNVSLFYMLTYGTRAELDLKCMSCKTGLHCVFTAHDPHSDIYAAISEWIVSTYAFHQLPVVHHIVQLPECTETLHERLGIPHDALVIGRHGGYNQFNIDFTAVQNRLANGIHYY